MKNNQDIIIVGGGLSGLTLAFLLSKHQIKTTILEGSDRLGGRIQTIQGENGTTLELGATWFSEMHQNLLSLMNELGLEKHPQFAKGKSLFQTHSFLPPQEFQVPDSESPSYRVVGGTEALIKALRDKLSDHEIQLNAKVKSISEKDDKLVLKTSADKEYKADKVVLCMPPQLAYNSIDFIPQLPETISMVLPYVQTWMAGSLKFVLEYERPFWRQKGYSGMLFSHSGIVMEMHDHTNHEENKFGFTGFLNSSALSHTKSERQDLVLNQLSKLLGKEALEPLTYNDKIWTDEFIANGSTMDLKAHQNNAHPLFDESYMGKKLFFSGTETAQNFSGYMEGAILSAKNTADRLLDFG